MNTYTNGEIDFENSWGNNACPQNVLYTWTVSFRHNFINLQNYSVIIFFSKWFVGKFFGVSKKNTVFELKETGLDRIPCYKRTMLKEEGLHLL